MSPIIINIIAYLAILTLLAFFGVIAWAAMTALHFVSDAKGAVRVIDPPKRAALEIVSTGKSIGQRLAQRGKVIIGHGKKAAGSVITVKDDVMKVYQSIDIQDAKSSAQEAADSVRHSGSVDALAFAKQIIDTLHDAQKAQRARS